MRPKRAMLTIPGATVVVAAVTAGVVARGVAHAQSGPLVPFTAERVDILYSYPAGNPASRMTTTYARRPDGSYADRRIVTGPDGKPEETRSVVDVKRMWGATLDVVTHSITSGYSNPEYFARLSKKPLSCKMDSPRHGSTILGFQVFKASEKLPGPPGETHSVEQWLAPALDCFPLKEIQYYGKAGGKVMRSFEKEVTAVRIGEPDPALFAIPQGYVERSPSQVFAKREALGAQRKAPCTECEARSNKILDERYDAGQNKPSR